MTRPTTGSMARIIAGALSAIVAMAGATASAQQPTPPAEAAPAPVPASVAEPAPAPVPATPPAPAVPPPPIVAAPVVATTAPQQSDSAGAPSDFDVTKRRWAIGYMGISQVPTGLGIITVPALGIRYWATESVGIDVGLGLGWTGGSASMPGTGINTNTTVNMDKDSVFGFVLHAGVPLALSTHRHVSFQLIPYFAIAHGSTSTSTPSPTGIGTTKTDFSGQRIDVGVRAGFELFFGFIGIPELALNATVGLQFESLKVSADDSGGLSASDTTLGFSTTVQNNPWDIFAGNVAARYYF